MPYTLLSSIDDCVMRNPYFAHYGVITEQTIDTLIRHAVFGYPMLIDSAFFVHNDYLKNAIIEESDNLVKILIKHGRIKIVSETGNIIEDVIVKKKRHEQMSVGANIDNLKISFSRSNQWLNNQQGVFIRLNDDGVTPVKMRKLLVKGILSANHPHEIGSLATQELFDKFKTRLDYNLDANLGDMSARSACEQALKSMNIHDSDDGSILISDIMTYAHEAFHITMAAHLSENSNEIINLETIYSNRFSDKIPYKAEGTEEHRVQSIKIPKNLIESNYNNIFDKLFNDKFLDQARKDYLSDRSNEIRSRAYEKSIYEVLGMKRAFSEVEKEISENTELLASGGVALATWGVFSMFEKTMSRRKLFSDPLKKAAVVSLFTGGIVNASKFTSEILTDRTRRGAETKITGFVSSNIAAYLIVDEIGRLVSADQHLENTSRIMRDGLKSNFVDANDLDFGVSFTNLCPDVDNIKYKSWKTAENVK